MLGLRVIDNVSYICLRLRCKTLLTRACEVEADQAEEQ